MNTQATQKSIIKTYKLNWNNAESKTIEKLKHTHKCSPFLTHIQFNVRKTIYFVFYLIIFIDFWKYVVILNLLPETYLKQVGTGSKINKKENCGMLKNIGPERSTGKQIH